MKVNLLIIYFFLSSISVTYGQEQVADPNGPEPGKSACVDDHSEADESGDQQAAQEQPGKKIDYVKEIYRDALAKPKALISDGYPAVAASLKKLRGLPEKISNSQALETFLETSGRIKKSFFGYKNRGLAFGLTRLAVLWLKMDKTPEAFNAAEKATEILQESRGDIYTISTEKQRLDFEESTLEPTDILMSIALYNPENSEDFVTRAYTAILRNKGIVLDSIIRDKQSLKNAPEARPLMEKLRKLRTQSARLQFILLEDHTRAMNESLQEKIKKMQEKIEDLEQKIADIAVRFRESMQARKITVGKLQAHIPPRQVLVDIVQFEDHLRAEADETESRYAAFVVGHNKRLQIVYLGEGDFVNDTVTAYRALASNDQPVNKVLAALYTEIWSRIARHIPPKTREVIISPDGELNFLPFAALRTPYRSYLVQEYDISYVASGRDIVRNVRQNRHKLAAIFGNPAFSTTQHNSKFLNRSSATAETSFRKIDRTGFESLSFPELPGTASEAKNVYKLCKNADLTPHLYLGGKAREEKLKQLDRPLLLHIATHGFFLPAKQKGTLKTNPMLRSGIVLSGVHRTLQHTNSIGGPQDGIVTAQEIGGLELWGTEMAVLSACNSGMGVNRNGEGVMGLRRAFVQAGVINLLLTLNKVNDQSTADMIKDFYARYIKTLDPVTALCDAQRNYIRTHPEAHPCEWAPFILSFQGNPR